MEGGRRRKDQMENLRVDGKPGKGRRGEDKEVGPWETMW
jgi:hypothetical protein